MGIGVGETWRPQPRHVLPTPLPRIHPVLPLLLQVRAAGPAQLVEHLDQATPACPEWQTTRKLEKELSGFTFYYRKALESSPAHRFLTFIAREGILAYEDLLTVLFPGGCHLGRSRVYSEDLSLSTQPHNPLLLFCLVV